MNVPRPAAAAPSPADVDRRRETLRTRDVMHARPVTCSTSMTLMEVAALMRDEDVSSVVVVAGDRVRGIVSDRDVVIRCVARGANLGRALVTDAMPIEMLTIEPDVPAGDAWSMLRVHRVRSLAVVADGRLVGVLDDRVI